MKVIFTFKGSVFGQKEDYILEIPEDSTVLQALELLGDAKPKIKRLLFKEGKVRSDILVFLDQIDVISMRLENQLLADGQTITLVPLAHGG